MCCRFWSGEEEFAPGELISLTANNKKLQPAVFSMRWGYHFSGKTVINARSETLEQKSLFAEDARLHRCVIPLDGYIEWDAERTKYRVSGPNARTLAGIYRLEAGKPVFTVLTRAPSEAVAFLHPRMPVLFSEENSRAWLELKNPVQDVLRLAETEVFARPVGFRQTNFLNT